MGMLVLLVLATCFVFSQDVQATEDPFRQTKCGRSDLHPEFYEIRLEAPDGKTKWLTFNKKEKDLLALKSTSLKHLKWASDLSELDALSYQAAHREFGTLSASLKNPVSDHEFGVVSEACWDGLRHHIDSLVRTREIFMNREK